MSTTAGESSMRNRLKHECGMWYWDCQCGYTLAVLGIVSAVISAGLGAYQAYSASQAQAQQARFAQKQADQQAAAEKAAGDARANQIQYEADKQKKGAYSRQAGAGVVTGQGSLLETAGEFAADVDYTKQLAKYPHELAGWSDKYKGDLFGFQAKEASGGALSGALLTGGGSLATSALSMYGKYKAKPSISPTDVQAN
jgi:hypothetical protein